MNGVKDDEAIYKRPKDGANIEGDDFSEKID
jgi:hypothetical protein